MLRILEHKPQRPVEILSSGQHRRKLVGHLRERRAVEPPPRDELDVQQIGKRAAAGRLGAQHDLALALQPLHHGGAIGGVTEPVHDLAAGVHSRPSERRHCCCSRSAPSGFAADAADDLFDRRVALDDGEEASVENRPHPVRDRGTLDRALVRALED